MLPCDVRRWLLFLAVFLFLGGAILQMAARHVD
jgi:hypothetical protein